jgi:hypothetical protein
VTAGPALAHHAGTTEEARYEPPTLPSSDKMPLARPATLR